MKGPHLSDHVQRRPHQVLQAQTTPCPKLDASAGGAACTGCHGGDGTGTTAAPTTWPKHPSRVHLDIETEDIEAEVLRLEGLGARRVQQIKTWWVMEAPTGQRFWIVHAQTAKFDELATTWP